ncbi:hypothetical protein BD413DRAFT_219286 [Trametes elegans]|nr:hypothetical protein BD413DRAFT_219286 [Trametes elegans]
MPRSPPPQQATTGFIASPSRLDVFRPPFRRRQPPPSSRTCLIRRPSHPRRSQRVQSHVQPRAPHHAAERGRHTVPPPPPQASRDIPPRRFANAGRNARAACATIKADCARIARGSRPSSPSVLRAAVRKKGWCARRPLFFAHASKSPPGTLRLFPLAFLLSR